MSKKFNLEYNNIPLVANIPRVTENFDIDLVNPWGSVMVNDTIWVANNATRSIQNYTLDGRRIGNPVAVNWGSVGRGKPTGIVAYDGQEFTFSNGARTVTGITSGSSLPARIIVVTEGGSINAYNPSISTTEAIEVLDAPEKIFYGAEIVGNELFVTNFRGAVIEKYNSSFNLIASFTDQDLVNAGYSPYNVYQICCKLYVTYAKANNPCPYLALNATGVEYGAGNGYISVFDTNGALLERFANRGPLNAPWGMTEFRVCKNNHLYRYLLVGNRGDGKINVYNLKTKKWISTIQNESGDAHVIDGLSSILMRNESDIFYTAGSDKGLHGTAGLLCSTT